MRLMISFVVSAVIYFTGVTVAYSCDKIPKGVTLNEQYTVHITLSSSFKIEILQIDNTNCWITGKYIKDNQKVFININSIMAISEGAKGRL